MAEIEFIQLGRRFQVDGFCVKTYRSVFIFPCLTTTHQLMRTDELSTYYDRTERKRKNNVALRKTAPFAHFNPIAGDFYSVVFFRESDWSINDIYPMNNNRNNT